MVNTAIKPEVNMTDMYMSVLASLSVSDRLDLIAKLSASIKKDSREKPTNSDLLTMFHGDWHNIKDLRDEQYHGRELLNW